MYTGVIQTVMYKSNVCAVARIKFVLIDEPLALTFAFYKILHELDSKSMLRSSCDVATTTLQPIVTYMIWRVPRYEVGDQLDIKPTSECYTYALLSQIHV